MKLLFAGTPEVALPSLEALAASGHDLVGVITRPDARSGRGRRVSRSPVGEWADAAGIEVLTPHKPGDPDFLDRLRELAPDCIPVVAYGALLPQRALEIPRHGWVNLHFSLLPAWRGAAPAQRALMAGDEVTGASVFLIEKGLDTGPVYGTLTEGIRPTDTSGDLLHRLADSGARLLLAAVDAIADGSAVAVPQPETGISTAAKITPAEAQVRWDLPGHIVDRRLRGCTPDPGAWAQFRGERVKLAPFAPGAPVVPGLAPGEIVAAKHSVDVGTADGSVRLTTLQPAGKPVMEAAAWARGIRPVAGECFA